MANERRGAAPGTGLVVLPLFIGLTLAACVIAGVFGICHDQLTYTLSEEYYTKFKFIQFGIAQAQRNRLGVAEVGWLASWWVGLILGCVLVPFAVRLRGLPRIIGRALIAFALVVVVAALSGAEGLLYAMTMADIPHEIVRYQQPIHDVRHFFWVGSMHNLSYMGALLGMVVAVVYLCWVEREDRRSTASRPARVKQSAEAVEG